jgi:multidrug efflux pump subunit AcrB
MKDALGAEGEGIDVRFEFDQSPHVTRAVAAVATEGMLGAVLIGLMILLFLQDWRSSLIVVLNIPLALMSAVLALWITGQTINLMTLGGLALAVGILVDEATVAIENIHIHLQRGQPLAQAVRDGSAETAVPRLLAMLCILAVFVSSFFMEGAAQSVFVPLSLSVGFAMLFSYLLSSTFVPILSVWLLKHQHDDRGDSHPHAPVHRRFDRFRWMYERLLAGFVRLRIVVIVVYLLVSGAVIGLIGPQLGREIFPAVAADQFRLRMRAPDGTHVVQTERLAKEALQAIEDEVGGENIHLTLGYVGMIHSNFPVNAVYQWSRGPEEVILYVDLKKGSGIRGDELKEQLRARLAQQMPDIRFSFEPSDIVNQVMSFGSPTPVEVAISGPSFADNRAHADKVYRELAKIPALRDLQVGQSLDYPTIQVNVDREKAGLAGLTPTDVSRALVTATSSSRFVMPNYWADPKSGIAYQVQVEIPRPLVRTPDGIQTIGSAEELGRIPLKRTENGQVLVRDVATIEPGTMPGQFDRYNMRRQITLTANITGADLGTVSRQVARAIQQAGEPPAGIRVETRGQVPPMRAIQAGLTVGLAFAVAAVFLLLTANFQSLRLALVSVSTAPAVVAGVVLMLWLTGSTLNIQSFIGAIMAVGIATANAILLVTFAEQSRRRGPEGAPAEGASAAAGMSARDAALDGASRRLRPILMTSCTTIAAMLPMAFALGEGGQHNAPLGRAVIGGLIAATAATLLVLPSIFTFVMGSASRRSASLDPDDAESEHYQPAAERL